MKLEIVAEEEGENGYLQAVSNLCWRRKWQPTPGFMPGESLGQRSLVGCHLWGRTDMTEVI